MSLVDSILSLLFIVPVATADGFLHISLGSELSTYILLFLVAFFGPCRGKARSTEYRHYPTLYPMSCFS